MTTKLPQRRSPIKRGVKSPPKPRDKVGRQSDKQQLPTSDKSSESSSDDDSSSEDETEQAMTNIPQTKNDKGQSPVKLNLDKEPSTSSRLPPIYKKPRYTDQGLTSRKLPPREWGQPSTSSLNLPDINEDSEDDDPIMSGNLTCFNKTSGKLHPKKLQLEEFPDYEWFYVRKDQNKTSTPSPFEIEKTPPKYSKKDIEDFLEEQEMKGQEEVDDDMEDYLEKMKNSEEVEEALENIRGDTEQLTNSPQNNDKVTTETQPRRSARNKEKRKINYNQTTHQTGPFRQFQN